MRWVRKLASMAPELRYPGAELIAHRRSLFFWDLKITLKYFWLVSIENKFELIQLSPCVSLLYGNYLVVKHPLVI